MIYLIVRIFSFHFLINLEFFFFVGETKEECQKYGDVEKCLIYEIPDAPEDEAVRIFVEFKRVESAVKGTYLVQWI
jgi:hypothetical protein